MADTSIDTEEFNAESFVPPEPEKSVAGYRILAILTFLLAVGGLFLGAIPKLPVLLGGASFLKGSLLSGIYDYYKDTFTHFGSLFQGGIDVVPTSLTVLAVFTFLSAAILSSLVCMIATLASRKAAEKCSVFSAVFAFLAYFGAFAWAALAEGAAFTVVGETFSAKQLFDAPTGIVAGVFLILLLIAAVARRKGKGFARFLLLLLTVATVFAIVYPGSLKEGSEYGVNCVNASVAFTLFSNKKAFLAIATLLLLSVIALCLFLSASRLGSEKSGLADVVYFAVLVGAVAFYFIAAVCSNANKGAVFSDQLMPAILLIAAPVAALLVSVLLLIVGRKKAESAEPASDASAEGTSEPAPAPAESKPEEPISEFERHMAALASGVAPEPRPEAFGEQQQNGYGYGARGQEFDKRVPQPVHQPSYFDYNSQYTYDPFINMLTPQEKNEFGDIFIAGKYGDLRAYLPAYVIGGNNDEFFHKVFIYLGKFRKNISSELLEKLYSYISRLD